MKMSIKTAAAVALTALLYGAPAVAQDQQPEPEFEFTMATWFTEGTTTWDLFAQGYADLVTELTDGRVKITPYPAGVLAGVFEGEEAVQQGIADMAHVWPGFIVNQDPANALFGALPGGMAVETMMHWIFEGGGLQLVQDFRRDTMGLHVFPAGALPGEVFAHSHKPVASVEDMQGLRHRTAGAFADVMQELGAAPTVVPGPEVFTMLERKAIDSAEYLTPSTNVQLGFHRVAKYVIIPGVHNPGSIYFMAMDTDQWEQLPEDIRTKMELAGEITTLRAYTRLGHEDLLAMEELRASNNEIVELTPEAQKAIREGGRTWAQTRAAEQEESGNTWMERIGESYFDYQDRWRAIAASRTMDAE